MHVLLDGDIVAYRCAAVTEKEEVPLALWQCDELIKRILADVNADSWQIYISGENNFRYQLFPDYKANRRDKPKPKHLNAVLEHLVVEWDTIITNGYEADDAMGISQTSETAICSIDKDLLQVPGMHYNFVSRTLSTISETEGWKNFYQQVLIGDTSDNISGCPGIGKVKAPKILDMCETPQMMYQACVDAYTRAKTSIDQMHLNAKLLYILRSEDDEWIPPSIEQQEPVAQH